MSYKVSYGQKALSDLENIEIYLTDKDPQAAQNVLKDIAYVIDLLVILPHMGKSIELGDLKFQITPVYKYRIIYRLQDNLIEIRRIYHPRQLPK